MMEMIDNDGDGDEYKYMVVMVVNSITLGMITMMMLTMIMMCTTMVVIMMMLTMTTTIILNRTCHDLASSEVTEAKRRKFSNIHANLNSLIPPNSPFADNKQEFHNIN